MLRLIDIGNIKDQGVQTDLEPVQETTNTRIDLKTPTMRSKQGDKKKKKRVAASEKTVDDPQKSDNALPPPADIECNSI